MQTCPCGNKKNYTDCCGLFIDENKKPNTPEELMRSRYTAYTQANMEYIARTMLPPASQHFNAKEAYNWSNKVEWLQLNVITSSMDGNKGFVEFEAYYKDQGKKFVMHEASEFRFERDQWYYIDGTDMGSRQIATSHLGRNDACDCGSGKKYKKCCGN